MGRSALLLGATGLVGKELLKFLIQEDAYDRVAIISRRNIDISHPKLQMVIGDLEDMERYSELFKADDVFCCLGTTIKKAKTRGNFRKVDYLYPLLAAKLALKGGAARFLVISALGASRNSPFFYNRVKGEMEDDLSRLAFKSLIIFRPSLLLGKREEFRFGERAGEILSLLFGVFLRGPLKKYRPVKGSDVAYTMISAALLPDTGLQIYESDRRCRLK